MGNIFSQYNPFSVYGEYNIKKQSYENKRSVIGVLSFILLVTIGAIVMLWVTGNEQVKNVRTFNIPPPKYGLGPYGYGLYFSPLNMIG
jgi:hypothetical protein